VVARAALVVLVVACSGKSRPAGDDAPRGSGDATAIAIDAGSAGSAGSASGSGEAAIRIEWKAVPVAARTSPGRTPCHTPRAPSVAPTTLFGIPDALVFVEGAGTLPTEARITFADCALSPRVIAGATLIVDSALDRPARLALVKHGDARQLDKLAVGESRTIQLPIAGHAVSIALDPGGVYQLAITGDGEHEPAWIVAAPALVTDVAGLATVRASPGAHAITAWLPARGGQPAKLANSSVKIEAGQLAEHTVDLGPP
jgi:hypothetical protein